MGISSLKVKSLTWLMIVILLQMDYISGFWWISDDETTTIATTSIASTESTTLPTTVSSTVAVTSVIKPVRTRRTTTEAAFLPTKPVSSVDVCSLPKIEGPCRGNFKRFYYDQNSGKCKPFIYGGCKGNRNQFEKETECVSKCVKADAKDVCSLTKDSGPCFGYIQRWFYNEVTGFCEQFVYGGCDGNGNNFEREADCQARCNAKPRDSKAVCTVRPVTGPCTADLTRYYFDASDGLCKQFRYGGCEGNGNRFETIEECEKVCGPNREDSNKCALPHDVGPCHARLQRYYFDALDNSCKEFLYGGCQGNENRFETIAECESSCKKSGETTVNEHVKDEDVCTLPAETGRCFAYFPSWYHDAKEGVCKEFVYGGCEGNGNRFLSQSDCEKKCPPGRPRVKDVCVLPADAGPCFAAFPSWYFDHNYGVCKQFIYGGCLGNDNRFATQGECEQQCPPTATDVPATEEPQIDICTLPYDIGPCRSSLPMWYYDYSGKQCKLFNYGGCQGNRNRFETRQLCEGACGSSGPVVPTKEPEKETQSPITTDGKDTSSCFLIKDSGPCRQYKPIWYYDNASRVCRRFRYGGCGGNDNRFENRRLCEELCRGAVKPLSTVAPPTEPATSQPTTEATTPSTRLPTTTLPYDALEFDLCLEPANRGPCKAKLRRWYYNFANRQCQPFRYGGCEGNANRFDSEEECLSVCVQRKTRFRLTGAVPSAVEEIQDICHLSDKYGSCGGYYEYYFYDRQDGLCKEFVYGGCLGNGNNFPTEESCGRHCKPRAPEEACLLRKAEGNCKGSISRWYFDPRERTCMPFDYTGCHGNANRFVTVEECEHVCIHEDSHTLDIDLPEVEYIAITPKPRTSTTEGPAEIVCSQPVEIGSCSNWVRAYFYDPYAGGCKPFNYGGCDGNDNNFATLLECENKCQNAKVTTTSKPTTTLSTTTELPRCQQPWDYGTCGDWSLVYFYDTDLLTCERTYYGGCGGNDNRFATLEECQNACVPTTLPPPTTPSTTTKEPTTPPSTTEPTTISTTTEVLPVCDQPFIAGSCLDWQIVFYYNKASGKCQGDYYSGCDGNDNQFEALEDCLTECVLAPTTTPAATTTPSGPYEGPLLPPERFEIKQISDTNALVTWHDPHPEHPDRVYILRYAPVGGDRKGLRQVESKVQGVLATDLVAGTEYEFYMLEKQNEERSDWSKPFRYLVPEPGATYKPSIPAKTTEPTTTTEDLPQCLQPFALGACVDWKIVWFYNFTATLCQRAYYGGCEGNDNRFSTVEDCESACTTTTPADTTLPALPTTTPSSEGTSKCQLAYDRGPGSDWSIMWYYNNEVERCERAYYGGEKGNANRFDTEEDCEADCVYNTATETTTVPTETPVVTEIAAPFGLKAIIKSPTSALVTWIGQETAPSSSRSYILRYFPSSDNARFSEITTRKAGSEVVNLYPDTEYEFTVRVVDGNRRSSWSVSVFNTTKKEVVVPVLPERPPAYCGVPVDRGTCEERHLRFYYDAVIDSCLPFSYSGCDGNENRFQSQEACLYQCRPNGIEGVVLRSKDTCSLKQDSGTCSDALIRWSYDLVYETCLAFYYTGCDGNTNNFETYEDCAVFCDGHVVCEEEDCNTVCPHGNKKDDRNCATCDCFDPCEDVTCAKGEECRVRMYYCITDPCPPPEPVCTPVEATGVIIPQPNVTDVLIEPNISPENIDPPVFLQAEVTGPTTVLLSWTDLTEDTATEQRFYLVRYMSMDSGDIGELNVTGPYRRVNVVTLLPETEYEFRVKITEGEESSDWSLSVYVKTSEITPQEKQPDCLKSEFGCCLDNKTPAKSYNLVGCPEQFSTIADSETREEIMSAQGDEITLPCEARGSPMPQVTWYKNRYPIVISNYDGRLKKLGDDSLLIRNAKPNDTASYICRAYNGVGESATKEYIIEIRVPVSFAASPSVEIVAPGETAHMSCYATGIPKPTISWFQGNVPLPGSDDRFSIMENNTLVIYSTRPADEGDYACVAKNIIGQQRKIVTLGLEAPVTVRLEPHNTTYRSGKDIVLKCVPTGYPVPWTSWLKDDSFIIYDDRVMDSSTGMLKIANASETDSGSYTCTADNGAEVSSVSTTLKIKPKPTTAPKSCRDHPSLANCNVIVRFGYCNHDVYSGFCCRSCFLAGKLDVKKIRK